MIIAPYSYPDQGTAGQLPDGVQMALVAWHRMQTCSSVSLPVAFAVHVEVQRTAGAPARPTPGRPPRQGPCSDGEQEASPSSAAPERHRGQGPAQTAGGDGGAPAGRRTAAEPAARRRQERKQQARAAREAAIRRQRRRDTARRFVLSVVVAAVAIGVFTLLTRVGGANPFPAAAADAAKAAGCTGVETPVSGAPGRTHLASGATYAYPEEPATSGPHEPSPLPNTPAVYTEMPPETQLVHNLEHAFVNIYYRPDGDGAVAPDVISALTTVANNDAKHHVILTPHTSLPDGRRLRRDGVEQAAHLPGHRDGEPSHHDREGIHDGLRMHEQRAGADVLGQVLSVS